MKRGKQMRFFAKHLKSQHTATKSIVYLTFFIFLTIPLIGCIGSKNTENKKPQENGIISGAVYEECLFSQNDDGDYSQANLQFIFQNESIIDEIRELIPVIDTPLYFYFTYDYSQIGIDQYHHLYLNYNSAFGFGLTAYKTHHALPRINSSYNADPEETRLPFWLLNGIEAVARRNANINVFDLVSDDIDFEIESVNSLNDFRFIPSNWGSYEHISAINSAYHFTVYLLENDYFHQLIDLYSTGDRKTANDLAKAHYYNFANLILDTSTSLLFGNGTYVLTYHGEFSDTNFIIDNYQQSNMNDKEHIAVGHRFEEVTAFVINWYSQHFQWELRRFNHNIVHLTQIGPPEISRDTTFSMLPEPWIAAHETVHGVDMQIKSVTPGFTPFAEGLATYLTWLATSDDIREHCPIDDLDNPNRFTFAQGVGTVVANFNYTNPHYNPYLNSYGLAGGFVQYLIETYGADKYFQVHWNFRNFEYVYNIALDEMVERWVALLREERV